MHNATGTAALLILALAAGATQRLQCDLTQAAPAPAAQPASPVALDAPHVYPVRRIIDGDTIELGLPHDPQARIVLRLAGIDTPEVHGVPTPKPYALAASGFTRQYLAAGSAYIVPNPFQLCDRYGRATVYVHAPEQEQSLNEALLTAGLAFADHRFDHPRMAHFLELEESACKQRLQIWESPTTAQAPFWRTERSFCAPPPAPP